MILAELIVPTAIATPETSVEELFRECSEKNVPGIPFQSADGQFVGKASIRHVLRETCIPDYLVKHATLLGDRTASLSIPLEKARRVLSLKVEPFVLEDSAFIGPESPVAKALAVMERHDTTYLFVFDDDAYLGCISIMGIGETLIRSVEDSPE
jgi:CBS domain-containing protein